MREVTVNKEELSKALKKNRKAHRKNFEEAWDAYREKAIANLESRLAEIRDGGTIELYLNLVQPEDHTDDYDRVLEMLKMHTEDVIEISEQEFSQYVQDDWGWKHAFAGQYFSNTAKAL
jgi:hypothetical protein